MTLEEYNKRLENTIIQLESQVSADLMVQLASDALATIRKRIQETGTNEKGAKYAPYSTKPMGAWCGNMTGQACSAAQSKYKRKRPKGSSKPLRSFTLQGGYREYRELHGYEVQFVNFMFTGEMWRNIAIVSDNSEHEKGVARIGAKDQDNKDKLSGNTDRRGDILALSDAETADLAEIYGMGIQQVFEKNGL